MVFVDLFAVDHLFATGALGKQVVWYRCLKPGFPGLQKILYDILNLGTHSSLLKLRFLKQLFLNEIDGIITSQEGVGRKDPDEKIFVGFDPVDTEFFQGPDHPCNSLFTGVIVSDDLGHHGIVVRGYLRPGINP
jgi:hypothetical protein